MELKEQLAKRFFRYAAISSESNAAVKEVPSSPGQWKLAELLRDEMIALGLRDVQISSHGVVTGHLEANLPEGKTAPAVGWVAHLDTVNVKMSPEIHPKMIPAYPGGDICQNEEAALFIRVSEHPELNAYIGQDIIVSDGTSVLGADNKAAIANIMTALEVLKEHPQIEHGPLYIAFVPDEEIGLLGAKSMDLSRFPVDFAYTIDCCALGEVVLETFHAASAWLTIEGVTAHPMSSKNNLVNPAMVAVDFINLLDRAQMPEHTEKKEGFIWVNGIDANVKTATVSFVIRDHDRKLFEAKKAFLQSALEMTRLRHPHARLSLTMQDVYGNISDSLNDQNRVCVDYLYQALRELGIEANTIAMRGGTDGSYLSTRGIPTPNYFTGAHNFHASSEFLPMDSFEASCRVTLKLMQLPVREKEA